jgi:hypothetical protein
MQAGKYQRCWSSAVAQLIPQPPEFFHPQGSSRVLSDAFKAIANHFFETTTGWKQN